MKIAFLAPASAIHTVRWVNALAKKGHDIFLITMHPAIETVNNKVAVYNLYWNAPHGYYLNCFQIRKLLESISPDLLNVHFASGYGTLGRLSGFHPYLLSLWGSDVFKFPYEGRVKLRTLSNNLKAADSIASTSNCMKEQARKFLTHSPKNFYITPFGVDTGFFFPDLKKKERNEIIIGMVKKMDSRYGPEYLIEAFNLLLEKYCNIKLVFVGEGPAETELKNLVKYYKIQKYVEFIGPVPYKEVPAWLNYFDIYCTPSIIESFGVAVIEASACGLPVVVSDVGGLPEVVKDGETGLIVPSKDSERLAEALEYLIVNPDKRKQMGERGRQFVALNYEWDKCVDTMENCYRELIGAAK